MYRVTYGPNDKPGYLISSWRDPRTDKPMSRVQGPCFRNYKSAWEWFKSIGFCNGYKDTKLWFNGRLVAYTFNLDPHKDDGWDRYRIRVTNEAPKPLLKYVMSLKHVISDTAPAMSFLVD